MSALEDAQRVEAEAREVVMYRARNSPAPVSGTFSLQLDAYAEAVRHTERARAEELMPKNDSFWSAAHKRCLTEYIDGKWMPVKAMSA